MAFVVFGVVIWVVVIPLALVVRDNPEDMGLFIDGENPDNAAKRGNDPVEIEGENHDPIPGQVDFTLKQALLSSTFWMLALAFFFQGVSHSTVTVHLVNALTDAGIPVAKAAYSIGLLTFVSIIGRLGFGYLGDYITKRYLFMATYAFMGAGLLVLMNARTMPMVYLFIFLFGVGFGGNVPLMPAIRAEYFGRSALGAIQGFMNPVMMLAGAFGPIIAGYVFDETGSYQVSFMVTGLLTFLAAVAMFFARPTVPRPLKVKEKGSPL
jgi:MFS family permease